MARGPKKHLKRLNAPSHWMLDKMGGVWAPRPSTGPHKMRESLPLNLILRNRLRYALTGREANMIVMQRLIKVDGKVRTDKTFPAGFMDVVTIEKTDETFRLLYDVKGRFKLHLITKDEGAYKLCKVKRQQTGMKGVPYIATHDARTIRYPDPVIKVDDTVRVNIGTGKIEDILKFEVGNLCMITGGHNIGRIGIIQLREKHPGSHEIIRVRDAMGHDFATRKTNVFIIGKGSEPAISLLKNKGLKKSIIEEQEAREKAKPVAV
ncbi:40S ribosomal protein S4 [Chondrus crispus]|uniref:40S ribosomal protein S4 n=1 Tax=Chondrus crispus TaxID=2769 RepID=R7Q6M6_CHOCR|nr:40S ribosomal protein S4 [Chondrus crispus]CDF33120.1 40S ribosomal protein S4 [Chondrus crispus]|eukprot:XP_005712924.1 40S ribosomal protein S4 [Chondrus crispus]